KRLKQGVELEDGLAQADAVSVKETAPMASIIEITLHDGRNRIVRRMMDAVGHPVIELVRTQIGPIRLGDLRSGRSRIIKGAELGALMRTVGL
ncbi:MAG: rRNA pseudouridine synthase, partial [Actinomycetes bacterium]|nr:rRNA pseudouridine synthase [Actinomycetes bacterium]